MGSDKASATIFALIAVVMISGCMGGQPSKIDSHVSNIENLTVHFLDVGQGDSILLQFAGKNVLIDGGEADMGSRVASYLKDHGVSNLNLVVASHPHSDHIGGLGIILKTFPVGQVLDSGQVHSSQTYEDFLTLVDQKNIQYKVAEKGQRINLDPRLKIGVLNPPAQLFENINDNSVVLRITYGQVSFLLMGDAEKEAEESMLSFDLDSDILKVGHHGSRSSSSPAFLKEVSPAISIIEVGKGNDYGHPAPETLSALKNVGSEIYRTDLDGNIDVTTDGESYFVTTQKAAAGRGTDDTAAISISSIQFDAPGDDRKNLNGEWIRVTNSGQSPVDMTGWRLYDESGRVYVFPRFALSPGDSAKVFTGQGLDSTTKLYIGRGSPIWNNNGDTALLGDAGGNVVSQRSG